MQGKSIEEIQRATELMLDRLHDATRALQSSADSTRRLITDSRAILRSQPCSQRRGIGQADAAGSAHPGAQHRPTAAD
jgi:hypothetical protein